MVEPQDTVLYKLRYVIAVIAVVIGIILTSLLISITGVVHASPAPSDSASLPSMSDSPNVVSAGASIAAAAIGRTADRLAYAIGTSAQSVTSGVQAAATATARAGTDAGRGVGRAALATADGLGSALAFAIQMPGNLLGAVSSTPPVSAVIKPADHTPVPVIEPDAPTTLALAMIPTVQPVDRPAEQGQAPAQAAAASSSAAQWPIHGIITTLFGVPEWPYEAIHTGLDISDGKAPGTTPIKPYRPGVVAEVIHSYVGLGNHITIDHGGGVTSVYGHLNSISVQVGQQVDDNTILGYEGTTGASTGTHLHFEIRINGQPVNPLLYISGRP